MMDNSLPNKGQSSEVAKSVAILFILTLVARTLSLLYRYLLALTVEPITYGEIALHMSLFIALCPLASLSLDPILSWRIINRHALIRYVPGLFILSILSALTSAIIFSFKTYYIIDVCWYQMVICGLVVYFAYLMETSSNFIGGISRGFLNFTFAGIVLICIPLFRILSFVGSKCVLEPTSAWFASYFIAGPASMLIIYYFIVKRSWQPLVLRDFYPNLHRMKAAVRLVTAHSLPIVLASVSRGVFMYILRGMAPPESRGALDLAIVAYQAAGIAITSGMSVLLPQMSRGRQFNISKLLGFAVALSTSCYLLIKVTEHEVQHILSYAGLGSYIKLIGMLNIMVFALPFDLLANFKSVELQSRGKHVTAGVLITALVILSYVVLRIILNMTEGNGLAFGFVLCSALTGVGLYVTNRIVIDK